MKHTVTKFDEKLRELKVRICSGIYGLNISSVFLSCRVSMQTARLHDLSSEIFIVNSGIFSCAY